MIVPVNSTVDLGRIKFTGITGKHLQAGQIFGIERALPMIVAPTGDTHVYIPDKIRHTCGIRLEPVLQFKSNK